MAVRYIRQRVARLVCAIILLTVPLMSAQARPARSPVIFDAKGNVHSFYGIPVTLTRAGLKRLPFRVRTGHYYDEGDRYTKYLIAAENKVEVQVTFDRDGKLHSAWTEAPKAVGPKGIRIGSTLADAKAAWPDGDFLFYWEDGYVVTYRTRSNVSFMFDPEDMPRGAFDPNRPIDFPVPDTIKIKTIAVFPRASPRRPKASPPIEENKTWMTEETSTDHKIISRLDVERTPGSQLVRLVWTHNGKTEADRVIDVSGYPEFDIWTRDRVWHPDRVVISFRYGRFKDCAVRGDDRDKVYVTLDGASATLSPRPPEGVSVAEGWPRPKYVGNSMNSAAHGCRRTYDPKLGTFGLGKE